MSNRVVVASRADLRRAAVITTLRGSPQDGRLVVVATTLEVGANLLREAGGDCFGRHRTTLDRLAASLATLPMARRGLVFAAGAAIEAVCARTIAACRSELVRHGAIADRPGFPRALARTLAELRMARVDPQVVGAASPELEVLLERYRVELAACGLCDRADVFREAIQIAMSDDRATDTERPLIFFDCGVSERLVHDFVTCLTRRASWAMATVIRGDDHSLGAYQDALGVRAEEVTDDRAGSLVHLQRALFGNSAETAAIDHEVTLVSAPGESRECAEIARRILREAERGVPFDRMAVLLRSPASYTGALIEAFGRANIPACFVGGTARPDRAGRAFIALLACAEQRLSARCFAEYLSFGVVPRVDGGAPPTAAPPEEAWELAEPARDSFGVEAPPSASPLQDEAGVTAPRRWEKLLIDVAVIGTSDRWRRRLGGARAQLSMDLERARVASPERVPTIERSIADLDALSRFAFPLIEDLEALPDRATWGVWLARLSALATRALRQPRGVLEVLAELAPLAPVGPVSLAEVRLALADRLGRMVEAPGTPAGKVYVAAIEQARGLSFAVVFIPGLAEKIFPQKVGEDPLLLDEVRTRLAPALPTKPRRIEEERLQLLVAVGAASERVVISYPRIDVDKARPRVPSFYALEVLRAAEGTLPSLADLARRAGDASRARIGWPAPERADDAIDEAEYDLAQLAAFIAAPRQSRGAARYLLATSEHLARALEHRARRWSKSWSFADGLHLRKDHPARAGLDEHLPSRRAYSATSLEQLAACPYRFFLRAIMHLAPTQQPTFLEKIDERQRGKMIHDAQRAALSCLRDRGWLPLPPDRIEEALTVLDVELDELVERCREELAPAILRVWQDGVREIREELREWLKRSLADRDWVPTDLELPFGLAGVRDGDRAHPRDPVALECGLLLRGAIDLVEMRAGTGARPLLRVTDHKTGKLPEGAGTVSGGKMLQPLLYAMALERLRPDADVSAGRLYACTSRGGFASHEVPLDDVGRRRVAEVVRCLAGAIDAGFLPAAPEEGACERCDFAAVCGPREQERARLKETIPWLSHLRRLP